MGNLLVSINKYFTAGVVVPALFLLGGYLTWQLRFVQFSRLKMGFQTLFEKKKEREQAEGSFPRYQAIATVLASNFGTGNISGMAVALTTGGPGALFWMWIMAFLGSAVQFANSVLGVKYRIKNDRGDYVGGPMYYLRDGLGWKKMASLFATVVIVASFTVGDFVQVNSVTLPLSKIGISPWFSGIGIALLIGLVVVGGVKRIAVVSSAVVPFMALLYLGGAFVSLAIYRDQLPAVFKLIYERAFGLGPALGGCLGFGVMQAVIFGFNRAIFATDAGTGLVPMLQSGACTKHPVIDGVATLVAPFLVMIVCSATVLVLLVTGAFLEPGLESTNMVTFAFSKGLGTIGNYVVFIALFLFGTTTIVGWCACLDRAVEYLFGGRWVKSFRWLYIILIPLGALLQVSIAWMMADIAITMMLVINVAGVAGLAKEIVFDHNKFFFEKFKPSVE